jgi:hypothetical protein
MKTFFSCLFMVLTMALIPEVAESQSRSPVQEPRPRVRPDSRSRPPVGSRRPLQRSRRSMVMQPRGIDFGFNLGTSHSLTDIGGTRYASRPFVMDTQWSTTSINAGAFTRYKFGQLFSVNASLNYGRIAGADSLSGENSSRYNRNFYFNNNIFEFAFTGEIYVPNYYPFRPFEIYGFVGIAMFYHDPDLTTHNPALYETDQYNNFQPAIPMGIGGFYNFPSNWRVGYEIGWRKTFFDYLDGFTRPASQGNDSYFFGKVKVSYFIPERFGMLRF